MRSTNGFVLAGGKSRRMGRDKAALRWGEVSLLDHMVGLISGVADRVQVVGRGDLPDLMPGGGPLGGILTALEVSDRDDNLILAVDLPQLTATFLIAFHARFVESRHPLLACRVEGRIPLCLGIRRSLAPDLRGRLERGQLSVRDWVLASDPEVLDDLPGVGFSPSLFANANTPEEWERLNRITHPQGRVGDGH